MAKKKSPVGGIVTLVLVVVGGYLVLRYFAARAAGTSSLTGNGLVTGAGATGTNQIGATGASTSPNVLGALYSALASIFGIGAAKASKSSGGQSTPLLSLGSKKPSAAAATNYGATTGGTQDLLNGIIEGISQWGSNAGGLVGDIFDPSLGSSLYDYTPNLTDQSGLSDYQIPYQDANQTISLPSVDLPDYSSYNSDYSPDTATVQPDIPSDVYIDG